MNIPTPENVRFTPPGAFSSDEKRFYIPGFVVHYTCSKCGCPNEWGDNPGRGHYIDFPKFNDDETLYLGECICGGTEEHSCYEEHQIKIRLNLAVEVVG